MLRLAHSTSVVIPPARVSSGTSLTAMPEFSCVLPDISHPTSYLPSHQSGFASRSSHRSVSVQEQIESFESVNDPPLELIESTTILSPFVGFGGTGCGRQRTDAAMIAG